MEKAEKLINEVRTLIKTKYKITNLTIKVLATKYDTDDYEIKKVIEEIKREEY